MNDVGTVVSLDTTSRIAHVAIAPPTCGRCETDGGHCDHLPKEIRVSVPAEFSGRLQVGYRVRITVPGAALVRAVVRLAVLPFAVGGGVLALLWRNPFRPWYAVAAVAAALTMVGLASFFGSGERDLPVVHDLLAGEPPSLHPIDPRIPVSPAGRR